MACTTILVGRKASYDGSTMIARNDDSPSGQYTPKKMVAVLPENQPTVYKSVISHVTIPLPENPMRYTAVPNVLKDEGIWAACGVNEKNIAMSATETICSNERVLGADPLVGYETATAGRPEKAGGIGEEDMVVIVLPYINSAREGVLRLGSLLEEYGTYEMNGIAFSDSEEIWFMETIGGHHWIARRVPDDSYVVMPNQSGIDTFDLEDALGEGRNHLCSKDLMNFIDENHLDLSIEGDFNPRYSFGTQDDADHVYNSPRAWYMLRYFNPHTFRWDGPGASYRPDSDDLPWCLVPEKKITPEDVKYILSSHYQGTPFDPYQSYGNPDMKGIYRSIGINRTDFMGFVQIRPYLPEEIRTLQWTSFGSNVFNTMVPLYTNVNCIPAYLSATEDKVSTDNFYWASRLIGAMADASYKKSISHIERYQLATLAKAHEIIAKYDKQAISELNGKTQAKGNDKDKAIQNLLEKANKELADMLKIGTYSVLEKVLYERSNLMKNSYSRSDN